MKFSVRKYRIFRWMRTDKCHLSVAHRNTNMQRIFFIDSFHRWDNHCPYMKISCRFFLNFEIHGHKNQIVTIFVIFTFFFGARSYMKSLLLFRVYLNVIEWNAIFKQFFLSQDKRKHNRLLTQHRSNADRTNRCVCTCLRSIRNYAHTIGHLSNECLQKIQQIRTTSV